MVDLWKGRSAAGAQRRTTLRNPEPERKDWIVSWEWVVLAAYTLIGPAVFHRFLPTRQAVTVRGGAVIDIEIGPALQVLRTAAKFGFVWFVALLLARAADPLWLRLWIVAPPILGLGAHFLLVRHYRVHWLRGTKLP